MNKTRKTTKVKEMRKAKRKRKIKVPDLRYRDKRRPLIREGLEIK